MYVFNHNLKTVEAACLGYLNLITKSLGEVFIDNAIGGGKEGKYLRDEVAFIVIQAVVPVFSIFGEINLFHRPEGSFSLLVELPNLFLKSVLYALDIFK